jgi:hypothetical protein
VESKDSTCCWRTGERIVATDQPAPDDVSRSSQPDLDALAHSRDAEVARLGDLTVVGAAEIVVIHAGIAELTAQQQAVRRRWVTALKLLTEAREGAGAETIAAARACADAAYREFHQIAQPNLGEAQRLLDAGLANTAAMLEQVSRTFDAGIAATDTRASRRPPKPTP